MNREEVFAHRIIEALTEDGPMGLLDLVCYMAPLGRVRMTAKEMGPVAHTVESLIEDGTVGQCRDAEGYEVYFVNL